MARPGDPFPMADNDQVRKLGCVALAFCAGDARDAEAVPRRACESDMPSGPMPKPRRPFSWTGGSSRARDTLA